MTGWCPHKTGTLEEQECHFDGYCSECPHNKSDLISRQAAIDATWEAPTYTDPLNVLTEVRDKIKALRPAQPELNSALYTDGFNDGYAQGMRDAQGTSAQPEQRWIPCNERLPEENVPVLGTFKFQGGNACLTTERIIVNGEERWSASCGMTPIAWQPLPDPWEGE